ncbi:putative peptidoglycan glycosyltransferase FtsW [Persephonella sp.]|uniref:FtsW/RodA/SpoVE family cell cycle protein n=1 Tax=Persephonella sp. TaxID=2060922 RepID=UPI0025DF86A3|nr:putative peptidoglycan glycosyltransferase FtsW [Persephonella sp.]
MIRNFYFDKVLVICFLILIILGIVFVFSATSVPSLINNKDPYYYLRREIMWSAVSIFFMFVLYLTPIDFLKKIAYPLAVLTVILLVIVLIFPAHVSGTSVKRWLDLGIVRFQPSELAKLSAIFFLAYFIHRKKNEKDFFNKWSSLITALSIPSIMIFLVLIQPHKGAALFIAVLVFAVLFSSKFSWKKLLLFPALFLPLFLILIMKSGYAEKRIEAMLNPIENRTGISYQVFQSILSFVKGGIAGEGIGGGTQKLKYLPEIHTDYIFALIGEEAGFMGAVFVIFIFLLILHRGLKISLNLEDTFSQVLGVGITYMIVIQAFFHIAVNTSLFPPTGFTLPFISYGGSSLLIMSAAAGILIRLSKEPKQSIYRREAL